MEVQKSQKTSPASARVRGIDICRSVAILLAMWSHVLVTFKISWGGESYLWLRFMMQMAPVTFICLFGSMLEFAYASKFSDDRRVDAVKRLLLRAGQCYVLYGVSVLVLLVTGQYSIGYTARTLLLGGITPFTDILKFYAFALALAPAIISFRIRFGLLPLILFAVAVQAMHPFLFNSAPVAVDTGKDYLGPIIGFLYGGGNAGVGAPSLLHGLSLVCVGIVLGACVKKIFRGSKEEKKFGMLGMAAVFIVSFVSALVMWSNTPNVLENIANLSIRNTNHPFYYTLGLSTTTGFLVLCLLVFDLGKQTWANGIRFIGTTSLFTFCFGNVLLYGFGVGRVVSNPYLFGVIFAILIPLQSWIFYYLTSKRDGLESRLGRLTSAIMHLGNQVIGLLTLPATRLYGVKAEGRQET